MKNTLWLRSEEPKILPCYDLDIFHKKSYIIFHKSGCLNIFVVGFIYAMALFFSIPCFGIKRFGNNHHFRMASLYQALKISRNWQAIHEHVPIWGCISPEWARQWIADLAFILHPKQQTYFWKILCPLMVMMTNDHWGKGSGFFLPLQSAYFWGHKTLCWHHVTIS